jgi:N-acyl-L-homoserine lactone synthetase
MFNDAGGFCDQGYRITWNPTASELQKIHELRASVFCRELQWVGSPADRCEQDQFDEGSTHIAVLAPDGDLAATARLLSGDAPWMLHGVFRDLVPTIEMLKRESAIEASRLAVAGRFRGVRLGNGMRVSDLLYKAAHLLCRSTGVRYVYMVVSNVVLRHMTCAGLPCAPIGPPKRMRDGVIAIPVLLDWRRIDESTVRRWHAAEPAVRQVEPARVRAPSQHASQLAI